MHIDALNVALASGCMATCLHGKKSILATRKAGIRYYVSKRIWKKFFGKGEYDDKRRK